MTGYHNYQTHNYKPLSNHKVIVFASHILLLLTLISLALSHPQQHSKHSHVPKLRLATGSNAVSFACNSTVYPHACMKALSSYPLSQNASLFQLVLLGSEAALTNVDQALAFANHLSTNERGQGLENAALQDCLQLLDDAKYHLNRTINQLSKLQKLGSQPPTTQDIADLKMGLSTALSYHETCTDGFSNQNGSISNQMKVKQGQVSQVVTNAMCLLSHLGNGSSNSRSPTHNRRLLSSDLPVWISASDRKLLQASSSSVGYNAVVATDGSAQYRTIQDAVNHIPSSFKGRYVIYIKKGTYKEIVTISKAFQDITFLGDGIDQTIITGNRNVASGLYTTFNTATVAISARGFMARDITFQNTAGASGHQAVALRAGADYLVFDRCSFEGYQDTLYALSSRQFYRDSKIYGTVDFIFGNAAAVFQNCELLARQPMRGQQNTYTAQGRTVQEDPTGFSFQDCTVIAAGDLQASSYSVSTYLGRPWKAYSRTVFLRSYIDNLIQPAGWLAWDSSDPFENTLYYGEYANDGPGAGTSQRVSWSGVHSHMTYQEASVFSVESFISGTTWLPQLGVAVDETVQQ